MRIPKVISSEAGFTLLEVLIASAIFGFGSLGVLGLVTTSMKLNSSSRNFAEASLIGEWKLDLLQIQPVTATDYTSCVVNAPLSAMCHSNGTVQVGGVPATLTVADIGGNAPSGNRYQLVWSATALPAPNVGLIGIDVTVFWPHDHNKLGLTVGDANFVNCPATPQDCYRLDFHNYRSPIT